jgi:hypothetical protein
MVMMVKIFIIQNIKTDKNANFGRREIFDEVMLGFAISSAV